MKVFYIVTKGYKKNLLFADIETEKSGKTVEEYLDWVSNNNPEIDWGEDVGKEIIE